MQAKSLGVGSLGVGIVKGTVGKRKLNSINPKKIKTNPELRKLSPAKGTNEFEKNKRWTKIHLRATMNC